MWNSLRQLAIRTKISITTLPVTPFQSTSPRCCVPILSHFQKNEFSTRPQYLSSLLPLSNDKSSLSSPQSAMFGGLVVVPSRGMKIKGKVKRRCKDCKLIWENGVLHNRCVTHPRHTQKLKEKYWANQRILTHATMSHTRPW